MKSKAGVLPPILTNGALCGCAAKEAAAAKTKKAVAVDPEIKAANGKRLRSIEGQIRGIQRMVEENRYCADILDQIASAREALRGVQRALMRNHLEHCATQGIREGSPEQAKAMYDELIGLIYKNAR